MSDCRAPERVVLVTMKPAPRFATIAALEEASPQNMAPTGRDFNVCFVTDGALFAKSPFVSQIRTTYRPVKHFPNQIEHIFGHFDPINIFILVIKNSLLFDNKNNNVRGDLTYIPAVSVAVIAEIPLRSPRKLFIFIIKNYIYRIKISQFFFLILKKSSLPAMKASLLQTSTELSFD